MVDVLERHRLGDQTENERHYRLARLGLLDQLALLEVFVRFLVMPAHPRELELRHSQSVVPDPDALVVERPRLDQLLVEEAVAVVMLQRLEEILVVRLPIVLDVPGHLLDGFLGFLQLFLFAVVQLALVGQGLDLFLQGKLLGRFAQRRDVVVLLDVGVHDLKCQTFRVLFTPIVQGGADRLGVLEAGHVMAAETALPRNALLADVPLELVLVERAAAQGLLIGVGLGGVRVLGVSARYGAGPLPSAF